MKNFKFELKWYQLDSSVIFIENIFLSVRVFKIVINEYWNDRPLALLLCVYATDAGRSCQCMHFPSVAFSLFTFSIQYKDVLVLTNEMM